MQAILLNGGTNAWIFEARARQLAQILGVDIREEPAHYNYVLGWEGPEPAGESFIPFTAIRAAADKRTLADAFAKFGVATPTTYLLDTEAEVDRLLQHEAQDQWVLKWPTGCGATGHRLQLPGMHIPAHWPRPFILQRFIALSTPEVYRLYCVANETFGWNVRRFREGAAASPFVAHARGAYYEDAGDVPAEAEYQARQALAATELIGSFGCVDLMKDAAGNWLVLEVNTDGLYSYVDRDIGIGNLEQIIDERIAYAFKKFSGRD